MANVVPLVTGLVWYVRAGRKGMSIASVSVVVPVRNRERLIGPCLEHLLRAAELAAGSGYRFEVVVANDASTDGTGEVVDAIAARSRVPIRHIRLSERQGPARARNAALEMATGELVVFVDSDVIVVDSFFQAHLEAHDRAGPRALVLGPVITVPSVEAAMRAPRARIWDLSTNPLDTANASVRREHLLAVGAFDSGFEGMGWQDIDLGLRLLQHGLVRTRAKGAVGYHVKPPLTESSQLAMMLAKERERGRSAHRFLAKHPGLTSRLAVQATALHRMINWVSRMGGLVDERNVLDWVRWARQRNLTALEVIWLSGVLNQAYLRSFHSGSATAVREAL